MKLHLNESDNQSISKNLMDTDCIRKIDAICKQHGFVGVESAEYTSRFTNLTGGRPSIFIDLDAYSYLDIACIDFDYNELKFTLRVTSKTYYLSPADTVRLSTDLRCLSECLAELSMIDMKDFAKSLDAQYYIK